MQKEQEVQGKYKIDFSWLIYMPIVFLVGILPLIVRFSLVSVKEEAYKIITKQTEVVDVFSQYKAGSLMVATGIILIILFLVMNKKEIKLDKWIKIFGVSTLVYVLFTILSAWNSDYRELVWWGAPDRAEGAVILVCYSIIMLYTIYVVKRRSDYKYIIIPLIALVGVTAFLGFFQYIGQDLFIETNLGNKLIIPEAYSNFRGQLVGMYEKGKIYGTMYHYNYIGSFGAMVIPLFMTLFLFTKGIKKKVVFGVTTILGILILFASTSRAGIIGLVIGVIFFIIVFVKVIFRKWKMILPILISMAAIIVILNGVTHGEIFNRIPSLINDAIAIFIPGDKSYDYKENLPIRGIYNENNQLRLETSGGNIHIKVENALKGNRWGLILTDDNGDEIKAQFTGETYKLEDTRFKGIDIDGRTDIEEGLNKWLIRYNGESVFYFAASPEQISYINPFTEELEQWQEPERIGFYGKERLGSARGYIWSRSLPLLKKTALLGYGPDAYSVVFPQDDYLGKWVAYDTTSMIVDKPHNLYLQIWIGQGMIALLGFLVLVGGYIVQSLRLYALRRDYEQLSIMGISLMLAIVGYLGAGIFNDSVVSVAPIFWVLLGAGIATNYMVNKEQTEMKRMLQHATISMKTRKHI